jgi:sensor histidine kinase YesM
MLLMPFVENAFKHGALKNGFLEIQIDIKVETRTLDFCIKNSVLPSQMEEESNGIGLENFRKRLDLNYSGKYKLETELSDEWYNARLSIPDLNEVNDG